MSPLRRAFLVAAVVGTAGCSTEVLTFDTPGANGGRPPIVVSGGAPSLGQGGEGGEAVVAVSGFGGTSGGSSAGTGNAGTGSAEGSAPDGTLTRISLANDGSDANSGTDEVALSGDGRFAAFTTFADNLMLDDTNQQSDVFVRELVTGGQWCASRTASGRAANGSSTRPTLSHDGAHLTFGSLATDLGASGVEEEQVLLQQPFDRPEPEIALPVQVGCAGGAVADGGRALAFCTATPLVPDDANETTDVYVRTESGAFELVSRSTNGGAARGWSVAPAMSADGNVVVFESDASDLVPGDTNDTVDVFVYDRARGELSRVSVDSSGGEAAGASTTASVSADGKRVAFTSSATNLVPGDTNESTDVFVHDLVTRETLRASAGNGGTQPEGASWGSSLDGSGRLVVFTSSAGNLAPGCSRPTGVFVRDLSTSLTLCVSSVYAPSMDDLSHGGVISDDGRVVVFLSYSSSLVEQDRNLAPDAFAFRFRTAPWL
jgi:Tol biopolymer transport system component